MFKFFRKRKLTEIERNQIRIDEIHAELRAICTAPGIDQKAPMPRTARIQSLEDEFFALVHRNLELMSPTKK